MSGLIDALDEYVPSVNGISTAELTVNLIMSKLFTLVSTPLELLEGHSQSGGDLTAVLPPLIGDGIDDNSCLTQTSTTC